MRESKYVAMAPPPTRIAAMTGGGDSEQAPAMRSMTRSRRSPTEGAGDECARAEQCRANREARRSGEREAEKDNVTSHQNSGAETPGLSHGKEAPSPFGVLYGLHTAGPAEIDACGVEPTTKAPMNVEDGHGRVPLSGSQCSAQESPAFRHGERSIGGP